MPSVRTFLEDYLGCEYCSTSLAEDPHRHGDVAAHALLWEVAMPPCDCPECSHGMCTFTRGLAIAAENGVKQKYQHWPRLPRPPGSAHVILLTTLLTAEPVDRIYATRK